MFEIGWQELLVVGVVALVVIGPKDLPRALHAAGKWVRRAKALSRDFQTGLDSMVQQAELDDLRREADALRKMNPARHLREAVEPSLEELRRIEAAAVSPGGYVPPAPEAPAEAPASAPVADTAAPAGETVKKDSAA